MNWGEIKQITLQKIDEATGTDGTEYTNQMWAAANEALQLLSTSGKYIIKYVEIVQEHETPGRKRYDLKRLVADFYELREVIFENEAEYGKTLDYAIEGEGVLVLEGKKKGKWVVYYNAYPKQITATTIDGEDLAIDGEVAVLIPLYIASQIFKFDDVSLATMWRNEFEAGREALVAKNQSKSTAGQAEFLSEVWYG